MDILNLRLPQKSRLSNLKDFLTLKYSYKEIKSSKNYKQVLLRSARDLDLYRQEKGILPKSILKQDFLSQDLNKEYLKESIKKNLYLVYDEKLDIRGRQKVSPSTIQKLIDDVIPFCEKVLNIQIL